MIEVEESEFVPEMDIKDSSDKIFYLAARATHIAQGTLLVTGNVKHYPVKEWRTMLWELV